ncbi:ABC transporter permease subunit [Solihabitans fulvus]|uniref:ABC transporter permease subunit n=2 Tax=Solihabitans fulvus TaxID=1892852 RepID=A0A5B2XSH0_9PSEU|nr:ABC transporter permease subunit [Solihabitans fulvus]
MTAILAGEWLKLRSLRATRVILGVVAAAVLAVAALAWHVANLWDGLPPDQRGHLRVAELDLVVSLPVQLCMAVLGVLAVTSEYGTGMIRASLVAVPQRRALLAAKAAVVAAVALVVGLAALFGTFFAGKLILGDRPVAGYGAPLSDRLPMLFASALSVLVFAVVGLGVAAVARSALGVSSVVVALVYVLPMIAINLPKPWSDRVYSLLLPALPGQLAESGYAGIPYTGILPPPGALAVLVAYLALPLGAAIVLIHRRDV